MKDADLNHLFAALAHPVRRRMLDLLRDAPGLSIAALAEHFTMSAVGVLKHVRVLERAALIHSEKHGREKHLFFNVVPIQLVYDRWTDQYSRFWAARLADIKDRIESRRVSPAARKGARSA
ncbi:MAG: helix-turn-helix transcriptional regulator [Phycisphaerales bacterium]|nr:helix-turn-helix transcriptional regulator [Phycisphaerales bacterium]